MTMLRVWLALALLALSACAGGYAGGDRGSGEYEDSEAGGYGM